MRTIEAFFKELVRQARVPFKEHDAEVLASAKIFSNLADEGELTALREAMAAILASTDERIRRWGKSVFAGYLRYSDFIEPPKFAQPQRQHFPTQPAETTHSGREAPSFFGCLQRYAHEGDQVNAAIDLYASVQTQEANAFYDALEEILSSPEERVRRYGVEFCTEVVLRRIYPPWARS
jgi:hypothetical protein